MNRTALSSQYKHPTVQNVFHDGASPGSSDMQLTVTDFIFDVLFLVDMVVRAARRRGDGARRRQAPPASDRRPSRS